MKMSGQWLWSILETRLNELKLAEEFLGGDLMFEAAFDNEVGQRVIGEFLQQGREVILREPMLPALTRDLAESPLRPQPHRQVQITLPRPIIR